MRLWVLLLLFLSVSLFGCSRTVTVVDYKDVYIPVACDVPFPAKPVPQDNAALLNVELLEYMKKLHIALKLCKGDE